MYKKIILLILLFFFSSLSLALTVRSVKDNGTLQVKISSRELTRIFVEGDKIQSVRGLEGAYILDKDDRRDSIFIKPTPLFQIKSFNLFITTDQGHTYNLLLSPMDVPAQDLQLKPLSPIKKIAEHWEKNTAYSELIINLITYMTNHAKPEGYAVIHLGETKAVKFSNNLTMQLLTIYRGAHLKGEIWKLVNTSKNTLCLSPKEFYQCDVRGASLSKEVLFCGEESYLYRVVSNA